VRFLVRYPSGAEHEVELEGTLAIVGRDPSCDIVLNDAKCSRRHAVLEAGAAGIGIRDSGSANGVFVNGRKVERAPLSEGDVIQLGEVFLRVLSEDVPQTVVMQEDELTAPGPPSSAPAPYLAATSLAAELPPAPSPSRTGPTPRPLTVTVLAGLWLLLAFCAGLGGLTGALLWRGEGAPSSWALLLAGVGLALLSATLGVGLWLRRPWARVLQIVVAALGLPTCLFTPACLATLLYMLRPEARLHFQSGGDPRGLAPRDAETVLDDSSEPIFSGAIVGLLALGLIFTLAAVLLAGRALGTIGWSRGRGVETAVISRLRTVASAQTAFHDICNAGYAEIEGLVDPASVIPNLGPGASPFLADDFRETAVLDHRFEMVVEERLPPRENCPSKSFRRYHYSATPLGGNGRSFVVGPDARIRYAEGRRATLADPLLLR
jgi:hypothetical protein